MSARAPWPAGERSALARLTAQGLSDFAIARKLGRTADAVQRMRARLGLRKHGRVRRRILRLAAAGYPTWEIALVVGRSESLVRMVKAAGKAKQRSV